MELQFRKDYKDDERLRRSFNELAGQIFGIDFERWYRMGFWNDRYICYSFVDNGKVVANASANIIDLLIDGQRVPAIQIGTVMTHPDYRRRGLAEKLMHMVIDDYRNKCDIIFLFANPEAQGFYERFGFERMSETCYYADPAEVKVIAPESPAIAPESPAIAPESPAIVRKLNISDENDVEILRRLSQQRIPLSSSFDTVHTEGILQWHCLNSFPEDIYYIESLNTIVIYCKNEKVLDLYDIICTSKPNYLQILRAMNIRGVDEISFHFTPESKEINVLSRQYSTKDYIFYTMSKSVRLTGEFFYPETAHA